MHVAYLGPELPALSATFIYEELNGLERRGIRVSPFSVTKATHAAIAQGELLKRTEVLYDRGPPLLVLEGLIALVRSGRRSFEALGCLLSDLRSVGIRHPAFWKLGYQWLTGARLALALRRKGCTHLHVHFAHTPAQIGMYAAAFSGLPFTITAHANDIFERALLLPEKARRAKKLLTISQFNLEHLRKLGVPESRLAVVRCGVSFKHRVDIPVVGQKSHIRLGTLCRLVEKKGVDDLIRAVRCLHDQSFSVELDIAGDGPLRQQLQALVNTLELGSAVRFLGLLDHGEVSSWLRSLDVFVLACKQDSNGDMDGIPVVLMEAMSQRIPVVSTRLTGIPELIIDGQTGLLAAPADAESLAGALRRMVEDPELRGQLSAAAVRHVVAEFGQQVNLDRLLAHIGSVPPSMPPPETVQ